MGESSAIYACASSRRGSILAGGRVRKIVEVWDAMGGRDSATRLVDTLYETGSGHLGVADTGELVAIGEYHNGVELWDWRSSRVVWRNPRISAVQSIAFAALDQELVVGTDRGTLILSARDGHLVDEVKGLCDPTPSPFGPYLFGRRGNKLTVLQPGRKEARVLAGQRSFGVLGACFTANAVVISETDGSLRAFNLDDGRSVFESAGWFVSLSPVAEREVVVGWSSRVGAPPGDLTGDLVKLDLAGQSSVILRALRSQTCCPIVSGTAWALLDGSIVPVEPA
jgi:WD40 repeat protein